jgi:hypothetical protein
LASIVSASETGSRTIVSHFPKKIVNEFSLKEMNLPNIVLIDGFYPAIAQRILSMKNEYTTIVLDGGSWKPGLENLLPYVDIVICKRKFSTTR